MGDLPVRALPSRIGSVAIEYLTFKAVMNRYRRVRHRFDVLEIKPISASISAGDLMVDCSVYSVSDTRALGVSGGYWIHWRYDCSVKEFVKAQVEPWRPRVD